MTEVELRRYIFDASIEMGVDSNVLEPIPKSELITNYLYNGSCRNASSAIWRDNHFEYWRVKWGSGFWEKINHYEDDDGYDVFVPVRIKGTKR